MDLAQSREHGLNKSAENKWVESIGQPIDTQFYKPLMINGRSASLKQENFTEHSINCNQVKVSSEAKQLTYVDCMHESLANSVTIVAAASCRIEEEVSPDRNGRMSCDLDVQQEHVLNDPDQTDDEPNRYASPDLRSEDSDFLTVSDTEDEFVESCTSPIHESKPESETPLQHVAKETGAGDCMMAVETKPISGWAGWQRVIDSSTSDAKVHCDDGDGSGEEATNFCSGWYCKQPSIMKTSKSTASHQTI